MSESTRESLEEALGRWIERLLRGLGLSPREPAPVPVRVRDPRERGA